MLYSTVRLSICPTTHVSFFFFVFTVTELELTSNSCPSELLSTHTAIKDIPWLTAFSGSLPRGQKDHGSLGKMRIMLVEESGKRRKEDRKKERTMKEAGRKEGSGLFVSASCMPE